MITRLQIHTALDFWKSTIRPETRSSPFMSYEWHRLWFEVYGDQFKSLLLNVNDEIIAPLVQQNSSVIFSGGYEIADYLDLIGLDEDKTAAWQEIIDYLKKNGVTKLELRNVPQSSSTIAFFQSIHAIVQKEDTTPILKLPSTWDEYLIQLPRKHRHELRRKLKKFEREQTRIAIVESKETTKDIDELIALMKLNPHKNTFFSPENEHFFKKLPRVFPGTFSIVHLLVEGTLAASICGFHVEDTFFLYNSGFDESRFPGAGFYLKVMHVKHSIAAGMKIYNFLQGSERYKYELGAQDKEVFRIEYALTQR